MKSLENKISSKYFHGCKPQHLQRFQLSPERLMNIFYALKTKNQISNIVVKNLMEEINLSLTPAIVFEN